MILSDLLVQWIDMLGIIPPWLETRFTVYHIKIKAASLTERSLILIGCPNSNIPIRSKLILRYLISPIPNSPDYLHMLLMLIAIGV